MGGRIFITLLIFSILSISGIKTMAQGTCTEPSEPECYSNEDTYKTKEAYGACTKEMSAMSASAKEYSKCLQDELKKQAAEVQKTSDELAEKINNMIKKFNCRSDSKASC